jgi:hypothetical protein
MQIARDASEVLQDNVDVIRAIAPRFVRAAYDNAYQTDRSVPILSHPIVI